MPLFAASISMRKLPGLDMVIGRLSFSLYFTATYLCLLDVGFSGIVSFSPPSSGNGLKYRAAKLFTAYIRSTLLFLFCSWVHCKRQVRFLSPCLVGQFRFYKFPQRSMYFMR